MKDGKITLLKGEGAHQHTLYGRFEVKKDFTDFTEVDVLECQLKHELPNGTFGEHNTLNVERGEWVMGKQVEYNPLSQKVTRVWD